MGAKVHQETFDKNDFYLFSNKMIQEVLLLHHWIKTETHHHTKEHSFGVEMEGWLIDEKAQPLKQNTEFISDLCDKNVDSELSQYNIELNGTPKVLSENVFLELQEDIESLWEKCKNTAQRRNHNLIAIGSLPTLEKKDVSVNAITNEARYHALNNTLLAHRQGQPFAIHINGRDELRFNAHHITFAAAATSFQFHWKVPISLAHLYYNASVMASGPMVALSANCPYLFGHELWQESRIPYFEHCVSGAPRHTPSYKPRAGLGSGFLNKEISEYFIDIVQNRPVLLPQTCHRSIENMSHLKFHNGTVWQWTRPVIGHDKNSHPHIRLEHRTPSSGPTFVDMFANMAFFIGLVHQLVINKSPISTQQNFYQVEKNFYLCARNGLKAKLNMGRGHVLSLQEHLLKDLIPSAIHGLINLGVDPVLIEYYLKEVLTERVKNGITGANWQTNYMKKHKCDLAQMTLKYLENQDSKIPLSHWGS